MERMYRGGARLRKLLKNRRWASSTRASMVMGDHLPAGMQDGPGGLRIEAPRSRLPFWPREELAEDQEPKEPSDATRGRHTVKRSEGWEEAVRKRPHDVVLVE